MCITQRKLKKFDPGIYCRGISAHALPGDCKDALATLCTELTRIQDGRNTAVDLTSPGLSTPYRTFTTWCIPGAVYRGYAHAGRPVGLPECDLTYRVDSNLRWQKHCSGPDFTRIIYAVSNFHGVMPTWSYVQGVCAYREACRLARIICHVKRGPKWHL